MVHAILESNCLTHAKMNTVRFPTWLIFLRLVFITNLCKIDCSETTHNKDIIVENEIQDKAKKAVSASLDIQQEQNKTEVNAMERTGAMFILDIKKNIGSENNYQTSDFDSSAHPSTVHNISVHDIYDNNGTDAILNFVKNVRRLARQVEESKRCQRLPLKINFRDIEMTWINTPEEYDANYCEGECNYPLVGENVTNHAAFQSNLHFRKPNVVKDPCCVPTELSDLDIVYYVGREEKRETMKDMVVEKCGCR